MTLYHIFYDEDKNIAWSSTAGVTEGIIEEQAAEHDYGYAAIECSEIPIGEKLLKLALLILALIICLCA